MNSAMKAHNNQEAPSKTWWVPLWRGLVVDPEAKHRRRMGPAIWLFLHLILHANRSTGQVRRRLGTLTREMGASPRTIRAWMRRLAQGGYIRQQLVGRTHVIHIAKWRMPRRQKSVEIGGRFLPP